MYSGSSQDKKDGYIHFSASNQVIERGDELFPHLYGDLPINAVLRAEELPLGPDGLHIFPKLAIST